MTKKWKLKEIGTLADVVSSLLSFELSRFHVCSATRSVGSVIQLKIGPSHEAIDVGNVAAAKAYSNWEWAVLVDLGEWSLRNSVHEIVSSTASPQNIEIGLGHMHGRRLSAVTLLPDGALEIAFAGDWALYVSVENIAENKDEGLWTIFRRKDWALTFGQGLSLEVHACPLSPDHASASGVRRLT